MYMLIILQITNSMIIKLFECISLLNKYFKYYINLNYQEDNMRSLKIHILI